MSFKTRIFLMLCCCIYRVTSSCIELQETGACSVQFLNQLSIMMKQTKQQMNEFKNEIANLNKAMNFLKMKNEILEQNKIEVDEWRLEQDQKVKDLQLEVHQLRLKAKQSTQGEILLQNKVDAFDKELEEVKKSNKMLEKSVSVTRPYMYFRLSNEYYKKAADYTWSISNAISMMKSPVFPLKGLPVGAQAMLSVKDDGAVYVSVAFKDLEKSGKALDLKLIPTMYFTLKNARKTSSDSDNIIRFRTYLFGSNLQYDIFYFESHLIQSRLLIDATIDIHVESPWTTKLDQSHDGTFTWAINGYRRKVMLEKNNYVRPQWGPYFFTSLKGYRVQVGVWLNGYDSFTSKGLSVDICFLTGPYDSGLSRSFNHKTTVTLLHPNDLNKHVIASVNKDRVDSTYLIDVATHQQVEDLLLNDTLLYQIDIVPL